MFASVKTENSGYRKYVSLKKLWENKSILLMNNILRVRVEVVAFGVPLTEDMDSGFLECGSSSGSKELVNDLKNLLKSGKDWDIRINCGGKVFEAHSNILKGRSVVFERMLESGMKESEDKVIKIEDVDPIIFEDFLEFIYTAKVELNPESMHKAFGLVRAADKYGIEELGAICFRFIFEQLSLKNAGQIAVLSYQHNAGELLRSKVVNFCHANWSELTKLSTFKECVSEYPLAFLKSMEHKK